MNKKLLFVSISLLLSLLVINSGLIQAKAVIAKQVNTQLCDRNDDPGSGGTI